MANRYVEARLHAVREHLRVNHEAGVEMSSASRGREREAFIDFFLSQMLPSVPRFGSGDITDSSGGTTQEEDSTGRSGQLDIVIEYPFLPSLPSLGMVRLYLAESVAAVIEVKSNVIRQWDEVERTAAKVKNLQRAAAVLPVGIPPRKIPLFVVGYTGWKTREPLEERVGMEKGVDGILVVESGLFVATRERLDEGGHPMNRGTRHYRLVFAKDDWALWGLRCCLHQLNHGMQDDCSAFLSYPPPDAIEANTNFRPWGQTE
jgi:hypothetical protein